MQVKFDKFNQLDPPAIFLCNPNRDRLASIGSIIYDTSLTLRFNALSEFSFKIPKSIDGGQTTLDFYSKIKVKRQIFIDTVGYFIINSAVENNDGSTPIMEVECQSLESEMLNKKINVLSGTFRLFNPFAPNAIPVTFSQGTSTITTSVTHNLSVNQAIRFSNINVVGFTSGKDYYVVSSNLATKTFTVATSPSGTPIEAGIVTSNGTLSPSPLDSLIGYILSLLNLNVTDNISALGGWKLGGTLDGTLASKYRTFDISDSTVYSFLMNDVEQAYECVFSFDTINREIYIDTLQGAVTPTSIFVSYDNLIENAELREMSDEIVTALHVYGGDGIDIRSVNPTGSNILYNFDYYKNTDWMTQELINAIDDWEDKIQSYSSLYSGYISNLLTLNNELSVLESELSILQSEYAALEVALKAAIEANSGVTQAKNNLNAKKVQVDAKVIEVEDKENSISNVLSLITNINTILNINNSSNFTEQQRVELSRYIIENTYQNENIIILDSYTPAQIQETKQELYNQALSVLGRVSVPRYEFSVDAVNFVALKEFQVFTNQIPVSLGAEVTIATNNYPITSVLLELELSYDNPEDFSMTFSNRLRLDNDKFQYSDLVGQIVKTGSSVSFDRPSWSNWASNYKDEVTLFITSSLDATKNEIINSTNQEIVINGSGLRGRKSNGSGGYENNQVWLTSNTLAFTDDAWTTAKTAVGRINFGNGTYGYGIAGEYLLGNIIAGNNLTIKNSNSSFIVTGNSVSLTNAKLIVQSQLGATGGIIIDPSSSDGVLRIGQITNTSTGQTIASPNFKVDNSGNVTMTGNLELGTNYIRTNGTAKLGGLTIGQNSASFNGEVVATKLTGTLDWNNLTNVPADKVSPGTFSSGGGGYSFPSSLSVSGNLKIGALTIRDNRGSVTIDSALSVGGTVSATHFNLTGGGTLATQAWVSESALFGYATQTWVNQQSYLKTNSDASVSNLTVNGSITVEGYSGLNSSSMAITTPFGTRYLRFRRGVLYAYSSSP